MKKVIYLLMLVCLFAACSKQTVFEKDRDDVSVIPDVPMCDYKELPGARLADKTGTNSSTFKVLFVDFDGHTVVNTSWNYAGPIVCAPSTLTTQQKQQIMAQTREDYSPFNVIVTDDSTFFWQAPQGSRMRCIVTPTWQWYGQAGGVAFINSYNWADNTPCFVFSSLLNDNTKYVQDAISHELGHTLGLYHQARYDANCVKLSNYNSGSGTGEIGWAPIMGVSYNQYLNTWYDGPNPFGCYSYQDDIPIIGSVLGFKQDQRPNEFDFKSMEPTEYTVYDILEQKNDADIYLVPNYYTVSIISMGNVDLAAVMYNHNGFVDDTIDVVNSLHIPSTAIPETVANYYYLKIMASKNNPNVKKDVQIGRYRLEVYPNFKNSMTGKL